MNDVQQRIAELQTKGWTVTAIAGELGVTVNAAQKWKAGDRYPTNVRAVLLALDNLVASRRAPQKRRYPPGSRAKRQHTSKTSPVSEGNSDRE